MFKAVSWIIIFFVSVVAVSHVFAIEPKLSKETASVEEVKEKPPAKKSLVKNSFVKKMKEKVKPEYKAQAFLRPEQEVVLASQLTGQIVKIPFAEGKSFKEGDLLIDFDCTIYKAQLKQAQARLTDSEIAHQANEKLSQLQAISKIELQKSKSTLEANKADLDIKSHVVNLCSVEAPFAGQVVTVFVKPYQTVRQDEDLIEIVDNTRLKVEMIIPSGWLAWLKEKEEFTLNITETHKDYRGVVVSILPRVDSVSRTVKVVGEVKVNGVSDLIAGMSGTAFFKKNGKVEKNEKVDK